MWSLSLIILGSLLRSPTLAIRYSPDLVQHNLNQNETASEPNDYWGKWTNHTFNPSPVNWRMPLYVLTIDRFVDGDPSNNDANGTVFEHDWMTNQFRFGGDAVGIETNLDYLQGMGIKIIYMTGSMMLNMPWSPDGYGPLDLTLLDGHHGNIDEWRSLISAVHERGMYIIFDNTMATMGDLLAYGDGFTNSTVPFNWDEYDYLWKDPQRQYHDFHPGNSHNASCQYPLFYEQNGYPEVQEILNKEHGCRASEFDMYGDIKSTGAYPSYQNQLSRFASVQDRLREWQPDVLDKIKIMSCMQITMLDIDGFRMDKAVQTTIDAMAEWSSYQRECARSVGKDNFLVVGEVVSDPRLGAVYFGRGKQPDQALTDPVEAITSSNATNPDSFIRNFGQTALDGAAFNYDVYGSMTRFLGLDGPWGSLGVDWVQLYNEHMLAVHDLVNANTGIFDPRHMFGTTNQDVFRWPALANGLQRQLLGFFVTTLELPGVPMVYFGEEQASYVLENLAADYVFGRTPMSSSRAWQLHGCYGLGEELYVNMPFNSSADGCHDDSVSLDHKDPSHPVRNYLKRMFELRDLFPVFNDGFNLTTLSTRIYDVYLPGSGGLPSPTGIWSVYRGRSPSVQDFTGIGQGNQGAWLVFTNENKSVAYDYDCASTRRTGPESAIIAPFAAGTTVKNLFYPYEEYVLHASTFSLGIENSTDANGCIPHIELRPWDFKAFVPKSTWTLPAPVITEVVPSHDARLLSAVSYAETEMINITIRFSDIVDCQNVASNILIESTTETGIVASMVNGSAKCSNLAIQDPINPGYVPSTYQFTAQLQNVSNGIHSFTVVNATSSDGSHYTNTRDRFMFRIGALENPMVFPLSSNYTTGIYTQDLDTGSLILKPRAAGADKLRYSTNWGSGYTQWQPYTGQSIQVEKQPWVGTKQQEWRGEHIIIEYWSRMAGSSMHVQHSDLNWANKPPRRWPHAWVEGDWNQWGSDSGLRNMMTQDKDGLWSFDIYNEWPTNVSINVWGINPDGQPDKSAAFGDVDRDGVLDWIPPDSLSASVINISTAPPGNHIAYRLIANDGNYAYQLVPAGSGATQAIVMILLCMIPPATGFGAVWLFTKLFYKVKFNKYGAKVRRDPLYVLTSTIRSIFQRVQKPKEIEGQINSGSSSPAISPQSSQIDNDILNGLAAPEHNDTRRSVLIATIEYEIPEWKVKVKIGGLGVMANLMGNNLRHQDLVWVVPCFGDVEYPFNEAMHCDPFNVVILGSIYHVDVYCYNTQNITFVLLDAPVFRKQKKSDPYPARMDDIESGVYYSAWNQCIAAAYERFEPDIYHINDYHGTLAPLYLLPRVIPCCLSLHNAEFQGLWGLKTKAGLTETCRIFDLGEEVVKKYVQYGEVFNLLHAGTSYLRIHQGGYGAVGVSNKYGKRSLARYPIFWGLKNIGALPNPDPTDTAPLERLANNTDVQIDEVWEIERANQRRQAQEWAGLTVDEKAELFIFVGRWSLQKGVDLIADVFYSVLTAHPVCQLICIGPVIDLHGKFAALKLDKLMEEFPGRVYSKPEFTVLPPYIFTGAEFALMPSRDEPFGLVAVEFGRKGALCIGARVGGFGHMPGWWFTVESMTSKHLIKQFKSAISSALSSDYKTRALMRAYSKVQRFPVAQWIQDLEALQTESIRMSEKVQGRSDIFANLPMLLKRAASGSGRTTPHSVTPATSKLNSSAVSPLQSGAASPSISRAPSRTGSLTDLRAPHSYFKRPSASRRLDTLITALPEIDSRLEAIPPRDDTAPSRTESRATSRASSIYGGLSGSATPARRLSMEFIEDETKNSTFQNVSPFFQDKKNSYYKQFSKNLDSKLNRRTSESTLCIQDYLVDSERNWFEKFHTASLKTNNSSITLLKDTPASEIASKGKYANRGLLAINKAAHGEFDEFFGEGYKAPSGARKLLSRKIGTWSLYCILLAIGQVLCANSYQLTLLTGTVGEPANKLYILSSIYLGASLLWWAVYCRTKAVYVLSLPWVFFGAAFFLLGITRVTRDTVTINWLFNVASGLYTAGSAAATMFFSLNFGTEGGTPSTTWALRAWGIAGTQQLLIAFLWYWGSYLTGSTGSVNLVKSPTVLCAVTIPLAIIMWAIGLLLFLGLPAYYRQNPGAIPAFYPAICRRGVVLWFWVMVILQSYWLSTNYNRNWSFLWASTNAPRWATALVVIAFFIFVWSGMLFLLAHLSRSHSWIIPIFAIGLGAPRWCQFMWSITGIGHHIPWVGSLAGGALLSRVVWCWLGVLDAIQGVGFGMILLMTLTRVHITFTLVVAQMIGAGITILARGTSPAKVGPGDVFLNLASDSLASIWFWVALACQLVICLGYLKFFRKAQLTKP